MFFLSHSYETQVGEAVLTVVCFMMVFFNFPLLNIDDHACLYALMRLIMKMLVWKAWLVLWLVVEWHENWILEMACGNLLVKEFQGKLLVMVVSVYLDIGDV